MQIIYYDIKSTTSAMHFSFSHIKSMEYAMHFASFHIKKMIYAMHFTFSHIKSMEYAMHFAPSHIKRMTSAMHFAPFHIKSIEYATHFAPFHIKRINYAMHFSSVHIRRIPYAPLFGRRSATECRRGCFGGFTWLWEWETGHFSDGAAPRNAGGGAWGLYITVRIENAPLFRLHIAAGRGKRADFRAAQMMEARSGLSFVPR